MNIDTRRLAEPDIQKFIFENENTDENALVLSHNEILGVPSAWIASQIKARKKASYKLPLYYRTRGIVYPPSVNLEQSSSETTARFKASIISKWMTKKKKFADLTGGLGIDSSFIAPVFESLDFIEPVEELQSLAKQNHELLGIGNISYHSSNASRFISQPELHYDLIYLDPSRRDESQRKVYKLSDCEPDVVALKAELNKHTDRILIKASPLLDLQQGINELGNVSRVTIVSVDNDCKELLFFCEKDFVGDAVIDCYNLSNHFDASISSHEAATSKFEFVISEERASIASFSDPLQYIYEPHASVMKGGAFKSIALRFKLLKLQSSTHLYTSDSLFENFPGRVFSVSELVKPDKKLQDKFPGGHANILLRNYPMSVEEIKKKTGLKEGGDLYLIGCSGVKDKWTFIASRIK